jgi:hypothetical protein
MARTLRDFKNIEHPLRCDALFAIIADLTVQSCQRRLSKDRGFATGRTVPRYVVLHSVMVASSDLAKSWRFVAFGEHPQRLGAHAMAERWCLGA